MAGRTTSKTSKITIRFRSRRRMFEFYHANHYVTSDCHSYSDNYSDKDCWCDYESDVEAVVIVALCYYQARVLQMNDGRIIYTLQ